MKRVIFTDPVLLDVEDILLIDDPDPELVFAVNDAIERLEPDIRHLIRMRFFCGYTLRRLADEQGITENEISKLYYRAKRQLKALLEGFVRERWGIETINYCRICAHPKKAIIENILKCRNADDSWKTTTHRVYVATGEKFHPPQILKAHLNHMPEPEDENNE